MMIILNDDNTENIFTPDLRDKQKLSPSILSVKIMFTLKLHIAEISLLMQIPTSNNSKKVYLWERDTSKLDKQV